MYLTSFLLCEGAALASCVHSLVSHYCRYRIEVTVGTSMRYEWSECISSQSLQSLGTHCVHSFVLLFVDASISRQHLLPATVAAQLYCRCQPKCCWSKVTLTIFMQGQVYWFLNRHFLGHWGAFCLAGFVLLCPCFRVHRAYAVCRFDL